MMFLLLLLSLLLAGPSITQAQDAGRHQDRGDTVKVNVSGGVTANPVFRSDGITQARGGADSWSNPLLLESNPPSVDEYVPVQLDTNPPSVDEYVPVQLDYRGGESNPPSKSDYVPPQKGNAGAGSNPPTTAGGDLSGVVDDIVDSGPSVDLDGDLLETYDLSEELTPADEILPELLGGTGGRESNPPPKMESNPPTAGTEYPPVQLEFDGTLGSMFKNSSQASTLLQDTSFSQGASAVSSSSSSSSAASECSG